MDPEARRTLEELALKRLAVTANDDETWSFLFRTEGSVDCTYCPLHATEDLDFDGDITGLELPWTPKRTALIESGKADPSPEELRQWREATARDWASNTERAHIAHIVPLWVRKQAKGYALFLCGNADTDQHDSPELAGVYDTLEEAKEALRRKGPVANPS